MDDNYNLENIPFPLLIKDITKTLFSGVLFISFENNRKGIIFKDGRICAIQSNSTQELLGNLLVRMNLLSEEMMEWCVGEAKALGVRLGEILFKNNLIKPEDLRKALKAQARLRFLDMFSWRSGTIEKVYKKIDKLPNMVMEEEKTLIRRGIMEKTPFSVVIDILSPFVDSKPKKLTDEVPADVSHDFENIISHKVADLLLHDQDAGRVLLGLYCTGLIDFQESKYKELIEELNAILNSLKKRKPFEILGCSEKDKESTIKKAYLKMVKDNHPDIYSYADDPEVKAVANEIFTVINTAYNDALKYKRNEQTEDQKQKEANDNIQAEIFYQNALAAIREKNYSKAIELLRLCVKMKPEEQAFAEALISTLHLSLHGSELKNTGEIKMAISDALKKFPNSDHIYTILGWVLKMEESSKAIIAFKKAAELNPNNNDAQRELRLYKMRQGKTPDKKKTIFGKPKN